MPLEIQNLGSGLCLDVANADRANGAQVQQFSCNAGKNQTWFLAKARDGAVFIRTGHDGSKNLDLAGGSSADHTNIQIFDPFSTAQLWRILPMNDGSVEIRSAITDKCLDVADVSTSNNALVQQFTCNNQNNQRWTVHARAQPFFLIVKQNLKCLDIAGGNPANNVAVQQYDCHSAENQQWFIQAAGVTQGVSYWSLVSPAGNRCLDVAGGSHDDHASVQQYDCNGGDNQHWAIIDHGDDYFQIQNKGSGKCLDVRDASIEDNAAVQQFSCQDSDNQLLRWELFQNRHVQYVLTALDDGSGLVATTTGTWPF